MSEHGPDKARVFRSLTKLTEHKLTEKDLRGKYSLTQKGRKEADKLRRL